MKTPFSRFSHSFKAALVVAALLAVQTALAGQQAVWVKPAGPPNLARGKQVYFKYCVYCHGRFGKGDGPAGKPLPKNPANLADPKFMTMEPDDELFKAISGGGGAVGESPFMPSFGYTLTSKDIQDVLGFVRKQFCKCQYDPRKAKEHLLHEKTQHEKKSP